MNSEKYTNELKVDTGMHGKRGKEKKSSRDGDGHRTENEVCFIPLQRHPNIDTATFQSAN